MPENTSYVRFCLNGHIVAKTGDADDKRVCPICGVIATHRIDGWEENAYQPPHIPKTPIGTHWLDVVNSDFVGKRKVDVFDVSNINMWEIEASSPTVDRVCTECGHEFTIEGRYLDVLKSKFGKLRPPNACPECSRKKREESGQGES